MRAQVPQDDVRRHPAVASLFALHRQAAGGPHGGQRRIGIRSQSHVKRAGTTLLSLNYTSLYELDKSVPCIYIIILGLFQIPSHSLQIIYLLMSISHTDFTHPLALRRLLRRGHWRQRPLFLRQCRQRDVEHLVDDAEPAAPRHHDEHPVEVAEGLHYETNV